MAELRIIIARTTGCPAQRLKLIRAAHALHDDDGAAQLAEGTLLLAVVVPLPPSQAVQEQADAGPAEEVCACPEQLHCQPPQGLASPCP